MKSVMNHSFSRLPKSEIQVSTFDRSHGVKTAFDSGYLVPIYLDEVLPGDTFKVKANMLAKMLAPMVSAPMDNIFLDTQWFYVPSRLLWTNFTKMMGERRNPNDSIDYLVPQITAPVDGDGNGFPVGSLADYFGLPIEVGGIKVSVLPFRAYAKIWDDWYRAEQLQDSIIQSSDMLGDDVTAGNYDWNTLLRRGKRHDYFTSALPSPQLGAGVEMPLGGSAPVIQTGYEGVDSQLLAANGKPFEFRNAYAFGVGSWMQDATNGLPAGVTDDSNTVKLAADLSSATAATINSLRMAFQLQRMLEADSRSGGMRYQEIIYQHFRTVCPDARLQRSEYLGGSSQLINIHEIRQSSATDSVTPQGNRASTADCFSVCEWSKSFTEHGYVIGLASVRCDLNYQDGINRLWSRRGRYDFYWPTLAHLGEQAVLNKEIYCGGPYDVDTDGETVLDDLPFGYQERYAEYRYHPSMITGKLRSWADGTLDVWHLAQKFDERPKLDAEFIEDAPPIKRVLAVQDEPEFIFDGYIECICTRPMPVFSIPGLIDHL